MLLELSQVYRAALNFASNKSFDELGKSSSASKIQKATYAEIREKWPGLPSTMVCGVARQVGSSYLGQWTKLKQHLKNVKKGHTKKHYRGLDKAPEYNALTAHLFYGKDYSWSKDQTVSVATLGKRIKLKYHGWNKHLDLIKDGAPTGAAKIWYDKTSKQWYLIVSIEVSREDLDASTIGKVKGVDVGQRCLTVSTDTEKKTKFVHGGLVKAKCRQYAAIRSGLQSKGTRSSKKALTRLSTRERRFRSDVNHKLAVGLLEPGILIGMEELKDLRENTMRRRKKARNGATEKQRTATRDASSWAYAELYSFVSYKSFFFDSVVGKVDARNTSKGCRKCGNVGDKNRPNGSLLFRCTVCKHTVHSDKNGADNILQRTVVRRQDLLATGCLSFTPCAAQAVSEVPGVDGHLAGVMGQAPRSLAAG